MTAIEDRPSLAERYIRAISSSHLEAKLDARGDIDTIIAAGWVKETLGTDLFRTRQEFDGLNRRELALCESSLIARVYVLSQMASLAQTRTTLGRFAMMHAVRAKFNRPAEVVMQITGMALDVWLDPLCHHCEGRGFTGGFDGPMVFCHYCHHTGSRKTRLHKSEDCHQFGLNLLNEMQRKADFVAHKMKQYLRTHT